ncbi:MAG: InlB B-repeat-containing protein [Dehalococcoidia bacterium]|nr:InlB B-repeat-containing protein [Dehalococcoidia bacterium]
MRKTVRYFITGMLIFSTATLAGNFGCTFGNSSIVITYDANGGDVFPYSETVVAGTIVILPMPIYKGYIFGGWYAQDGMKVGTAGDGYIVNNAMTLYARWMPEGSMDYSEIYAYERGVSRYYVNYEIHYYVNDALLNKVLSDAYFDSYAAAWAFSFTGGVNPMPYYEEVWTDGVNRWWVEYERGNYRVEIEDTGDRTRTVYYGPLLPGTFVAPTTLSFTEEGHTNQIEGVQGVVTTSEKWLLEDPGYFGGDEPIIVYEYWWVTTYVGWVYGMPDIYTVRIVPANNVIHSCR